MLLSFKDKLVIHPNDVKAFEQQGQHFLKHKKNNLMLIILRKHLYRLSRMKQRLSELERKADTRRKIQLGGLVIKSGLENESTAVLLGILLEAAELLHRDHAKDNRLRWQIKGELAFLDK